MSLKSILAKTSAELGTDISVATEREFLINKINEAAKELYESRDLAYCEREQLFSLDNTQQQIALPCYVGHIRGIRNHTTRRQIVHHDMRPRYKAEGWTEPFLAWRKKRKSPLCRDITNAAPVDLSIPQAELAPFSVSVGGSTEYSERVVETLTFAPGDINKTTAHAFTDITVFSNNAPHTYNVTMTDNDGNVLAVLPNWRDTSEYLIVQVLDFFVSSPGNPYLCEVLYKIAWRPMREDYDEFICPGYDDAIYWQTLGNYKGKTDADVALLCLRKAAGIVSAIERDMTQGQQKTVDFERNETLFLFNRYRNTAWPNLFPGGYPQFTP